jgi:hypothetical protein
MSKAQPTPNTRTIQLRGTPDGLEIRQTYNRRGRFTTIPLIQTGNSRSKEPDLLDLLGEMSKAARDLFLTIKCNMDYRTHTAVLPNKGRTPSQINKRSSAIKELEHAGKGLACRVPTKGIKNISEVEQRYRPSTFMLSPGYIYPGRNFEKEIQHTWFQCTEEWLTLTMEIEHSPPQSKQTREIVRNLDQQDQQPEKVSKRPKKSLFHLD